MELRTAVTCSRCKRPIVSGEGFGFVYFKIPGKATTSSTAGSIAGIAGKPI